MKISFNPDDVKSVYLKKEIKKLSASDLRIVTDFFDNDFKDVHSAMEECNRMFLDKSDKPRQWTRIIEICSCLISDHLS